MLGLSTGNGISQNRYKAIFENAIDAIFLYQVDENEKFSKFIEVNKAACRKLEYSKEEFLNLKLADISWDTDVEKEMPGLQELAEKNGQALIERTLKSKSGKIFFVEISCHLFELDNLPVILSIVRDITERKKMETELKESEERYRQLVELAPIAICVHCDGKIVFANKKCLKMLEFTDGEEIIGKDVMSFVHPDYITIVKTRIKEVLFHNISTDLMEQKFITRAGRIIDVESAATPISDKGKKAVLVVVKDITERKKHEEQLKRTKKILQENEKLSLISQMAGVVAHEIRNPLTAVNGFTQLLCQKYENDQTIKTYINIMLNELASVDKLVIDFLQIAHPKQPKLKIISANNILKKVMKVINGQLRLNKIGLIHNFYKDLPLIMVDENQIKQAVLNILNYAIENMASGGKIQLATDLDENDKEILIEIILIGCKISNEVLANMGMPLYNIRDLGTGLSLSISYSIIKAHNGRIEIDKNFQEGFKITIYLPRPEDHYG